jgi:uncharacterized protein YndB with AHSA1/START domain
MPEKNNKETRKTIEMTVTIDAPVETVWRALTEAEELTNWFPLEARVTPGEGGVIRLSWGGNMAGEAPITIWEPNRHFRWVEGDDPDTQVVVEFFLETQKGKTVVRLVDSGFSTGADWEDYYDSKHCGWDFELRSLQHYLELHGGARRHAVWARKKITLSREEAWSRLLGPGGLARKGSLEGLKARNRYAVTAATGDHLEGVVHTYYPQWQFGATVENLQDSLLRVELEPGVNGALTAYVWLSSWRLPEAEVTAFHDRWTAQLETLFPKAIEDTPLG